METRQMKTKKNGSKTAVLQEDDMNRVENNIRLSRPNSSAKSVSAASSKTRQSIVSDLQCEIEAAERRLSLAQRDLIDKRLMLEKATDFPRGADRPHSREGSSASIQLSRTERWARDVATKRANDYDAAVDADDVRVPAKNGCTRAPPAETAPDRRRTYDLEHHMGAFLARQTTARDLPTFFGDPEDWPLFYSQYKTTTRICGYTDDENISRLTKCLRGKARNSVAALLISASNIDKIISTLKLRFGRPEFIIETLLQKIKSMRDVREADTLQLIEYATEVQNVSATMISTEETGHMMNPTLIKDIVGKLPPSLRLQWGMWIEQKSIHKATLEHLADWLMGIAAAASHVTQVATRSEKKSTHETKDRPRLCATTAAASATTATTYATDKDSKHKCQLCEGGHRLYDCPTFLRKDPDGRWTVATEKKLCFSCLSPRHHIGSCKKSKQCSKCNMRHHKLLHTSAPHKTVNGSSYTDTDDLVAAVNKNNVNYRNSQTVLLKVVPVIVSGSNGDIVTTALLDEEASVSLMDASLAERAGLQGPSEKLRLKGVGEMTTVDYTSRKVTCKISGLDMDEKYDLINVRTVKNLCLSVPSVDYKTLSEKWTHVGALVKYKYISDKKPEVLIGQDNIHLIVSRKVIEGPKNAPLVSETRLGYVVHGVTSSMPSDAMVFHMSVCDELYDPVKRNVSSETIGIKPCSDDLPRFKEDERAFSTTKTTTTFWSDSTDEGRVKTFLAHRNREITELTDVRNRRWAPTTQNETDDATRDSSEISTKRSKGPDFLHQPEYLWPQDDRQLPNHKSEDSKAKTVHVTITSVTCFPEGTQKRDFYTKIKRLRSNKEIPKESSLYQLIPFIDENGINRVGGRIDFVKTYDDTKNPIIVSPKDRLTQLLIMRYHYEAAHAGREQVLNNIRQGYWVINGRNAVKASWNRCRYCNNNRARPTPPQIGQLPDARLGSGYRHFTFTGIDFFGPITIKIGPRHKKKWCIALLTRLGLLDDGDLLKNNWRASQGLADHLWKRWIKEYLPTLTTRTKWYKTSDPLRVDDIVIIVDDQLPRNLWPKGKVIDVHAGKDGQVRVADVKTALGTYRRPATKLCKLDVRTP